MTRRLSKPLRLAFLGTPDFAVPALDALAAAGHEIACVYSQPPRPTGRGQTVRRSPVHEAALQLGIPVRTPARLRRDAAEHAAFASLELDCAVVAAYGLLLPPAMLAAPRRGCLNIHASLLPRWRGAAPIQAAILAGDAQSGVTIMRMEESLDTGPMLLARSVPLGPDATAASLHDALSRLGADLILHALDEQPAPVAQPGGATYAPKLGRDDARIEWSQPAAVLERRVRALNPWPGTLTTLNGETLKVLAASLAQTAGAQEHVPVRVPDCAPGSVLDDRLTVACGQGALRLQRVQRPGRSALAAADFLRGSPVAAGTVLG